MAVRILGGSHRSRLLVTPAGQNTRPTRSMVREAVFNILQGEVSGRQVLDLFAGSGAMGLEALSRGAAHAVFCDRQPQAVRAVKENLRHLQLEDKARVLQSDWHQAIGQLSRLGLQFHLIFLDPPYKMDVDPLLKEFAKAGLLEADGYIILEQSRDTSPEMPGSLMLDSQRRYGQTHVFFITREGEPA